jgi:hypothetical protein
VNPEQIWIAKVDPFLFPPGDVPMDIPISSNRALFSTIVFTRGLQKIGSTPTQPMSQTLGVGTACQDAASLSASVLLPHLRSVAVVACPSQTIASFSQWTQRSVIGTIEKHLFFLFLIFIVYHVLLDCAITRKFISMMHSVVWFIADSAVASLSIKILRRISHLFRLHL